MTPLEMLGVFAAGIGAGALNAVVGSGTLVTFPVLLAVGLSPLTATVSNALGLVPGAVSGAIGYRRELAGQGRRVRRLGVGAALGGITGACLLLTLPAEAFETIVPCLVGLALVLVALQPLISRTVRNRRPADRPVRRDGGWPLSTGLTLASVYGGYFAAAQGIIYISLMGLVLDEPLQRLNAVKNVLVAVVNTVAATLFLFVADFDWTAVALVAAGSALGGQLGAMTGRRFRPAVLRALVVAVGTVALVQLLLR
ncbi:sulfite exporter TauE/SafE family protein [Streptomyces sp. Vc74B-19]|uniref:sulfite exporter TauE/SafE family protein n=1 Tax=unclassified Streptomyces TaxID=2593676 RepID=UPI001BFC407B|nr:MULTISPECIES: sulfite exporter TauE/SafE family protein [unclassified Streptomyces]MBT3165222.1 sulfite exporter TauE/SafE family protein [Streptomyces sp. Vc74B-19]MDU0304635.1 sulfite exporter TauE/SafE family protein [Streptomyces sp. PAL114]